MSSSAAPSASRTSALLSPSSTPQWHVGISPKFPPSLVLSNDAAIESLIMDIPFLSVGLLGFGVITFFFAMRKFHRLAFYVFASTIVAFIAGILDVGQVLIRGKTATNNDADVASVLPLLIARELALSVSIGIRFFFFWSFASLAPRGERPLIRASLDQRPNFLRMDSDVHSGSWARWGFVGALLKYILLLATLAIPVLQLIWRLVAQFSKFGPVYNADAGLEIVVSALFIIKLFANAWLSPLTPRWKTIRDYSPVIAALLFGLGVGVGDILCFQFSETSLGRLLQAVELYILVLYILISSFYHNRPRMSMVGAPKNRRSMAPTPFEGIQPVERTSSLRIVPPSVSTPQNVGSDISSRTETPTPRRVQRLSSWLIPDANTNPERAGGPRRASTAERLASWLTNRRASGRKDREKSRLWTKEDMETGNSPIDEKTGYAASPDPSPTEPRETATWKDPVYTSVAPTNTATERLERITTALDAPPSSYRNTGAASPGGTVSSFNVDNLYGSDFLPPPRRPNPPGSPVYGLEGIVGYGPSKPRPASVQSSGMESLLRQQAELDKSVAELQIFSPSSRASVTTTTGGRLIVPGGQPESLRSDFSLSNFPDPPLNPPKWVEENEPNANDAPPGGGFVVDDVPFAMMQPRIPVAAVESVRQQSFPSTTRWSSESAMLGLETTNRTFPASGGTQYDVTSFIGDLTTPALKESFSQVEKQKPPVSRVVAEQSDPVQPSTSQVEPAGGVAARVQRVPPALVLASDSNSALPRPARRGKQGPPGRSRLNITGPFPRGSALEKSSAYERPRPVPAP